MREHIQATLALRAIWSSASKCLGVCAIEAWTVLTRMQADAAVRYLVQRHLVEHHKRGCYRITQLGIKAATSVEGVIKSKTGIAATATAQQTSGATGIRAAAWRALRMSPNMTLEAMMIRIDDGDTPNARERVQRYFAGLVAAGVITRKGKAYLLINDLGPIAPTVGAKHTFDPNAGVFLVGGPELKS